MSSFIHTDCHFNSVERAIQHMLVGRQASLIAWDLIKQNPKLNASHNGIDAVWEHVSVLMDEVRKLSALCVSLQYKHHHEGVLDSEIEEQTSYLLSHKSTIVSLSLFELYKAIQSILYQIETEHLKQLRDLTALEKESLDMLNILKVEMPMYLIDQLEEYQNARWSIS